MTLIGMANHHIDVTGTYYFPGLYTAIIPMIPGICGVWWLIRNRHQGDSQRLQGRPQAGAPEGRRWAA
jgi:hypothetical protein